MYHAPEHHPARTRRGFTLLELTIAIGIMATVMAVVAQAMASASSSTTTISLVADLQSDAAYTLDRIARDMRGARLPTPPALNTFATSISYQPIPPFTAALDETNLFVGADTLTLSNPATTPGLLTLNRNGVSTETMAANVPTTFPVSSQALGLPAGLTLPGFFAARTTAKSLRLYLALSGTDASGNAISRFAMIEVPTAN